MSEGKTPALDAALDELYSALPEEFVLVRSRLERDLRAAGDGDAAADIKRRRRPHLAAWALNQLARDRPDGIAELFETTNEVATAQQRALGGGSGDDLRDAARRRQDTIDELTDAALRTLARHAPKPAQYRDNLVATLDAATLDADAAEQLRVGQLTHPMLPPAGFGPIDALPPAPTSSRPAPSARSSKREIDKALREVEKARRDAEALREVADEADAVVTSADLAAQSALAHLHEVDLARDRARVGLEEANARLTAAQEAAIAARRTARQAEAHAEESEARLSTVEDGRPG